MRLSNLTYGEQYGVELVIQCDGCNGLAYTQQLRRKNIPEGGTKDAALIKINDTFNVSKKYTARNAVKAFTNTILEMIVNTEGTNGKGSFVLRSLTNDINWIIQQTSRCVYHTRAVLMSNKALADINQKEYLIIIGVLMLT